MENQKKQLLSRIKIFAIVGGVVAVFCLFLLIASVVSPSKPYEPISPPLSATNQPKPIKTSSPEPTITEIVSSRCVPASSEQLEAIRAGIQDVAQSNDIKSGWSVKSNDFVKVWFVAARIYGPGMEDGTEPGLWAISGEFNRPGMILSVGGFAIEFSSYPDASKTDAETNIFNDGAQDALDCARND